MNPSIQLLAGPCHSPALRRGDFANCCFRKARVVITGRSNARIPWPLCRVVNRRGTPGLLVDMELLRVIRNESAAAVMYWWGVSERTVSKWRTTFGVTNKNNPGSMRLFKLLGVKHRQTPMSPERRELQRCNAVQLNLAQHIAKYRRSNGPDWTAKEIALLGTDADGVIAEKIVRSYEAVSKKRKKLGIPRIRDRRGHRRRKSE